MQLTISNRPVSYTHLDVYKRQIEGQTKRTLFVAAFECIAYVAMNMPQI